MERNFSHLVHRLLRARGWKQKHLVERTGLDKSRLSRYINGSRGAATTDEAIKQLASAFEVREDLFRIAQGQIPDQLYSTLCTQHPETTLSILEKLAISLTKRADTSIEDLSRDVLFRYLEAVGREFFSYPINIKDLLQKVYGLDVLERPFSELGIPDPPDGKLCGLFVPEYTRVGRGTFHNVVLLNTESLNRSKTGEEIGRFTMAHEAFHREMWDLHCVSGSPVQPEEKSVVYCRIQDVEDTDPQKMEIKANHFAGALLMPAKDILKQVTRYPDPLDIDIYGHEIRSRYGVTISALRVRLRLLGVSFFESSEKVVGRQLKMFEG